LFCLINELRTLQKEVALQNEALHRSQLELVQVNGAMTTLMEKMNQIRSEVEKTVYASIKRLILPYVDKLKHGPLQQDQKTLVDILESNLLEIVKPFVADMNALDGSFTPMEIQISHLVRAGRTNKEIARILTIAPRTVGFHRENIRRKLGINNKKVNLRSVLLSCG
jgi:DNA-binding CsgD family transcriptional regulator